MNTVAKLALSLGAIGFALAGATAQAQTNVISDPVGFYRININPGANAISFPLQTIQSYRGTVSTVVGNSINFSGTPSFTNNQFAPVAVPGLPGTRAQYIAIVRNDADKTNGAPNNVTGDWWVINANSTTNITVVPGGDTISTLLAAGDQVEIRKLTTLADVFGTGAGYRLNTDSVGAQDVNDTDVIAVLSGTSFSETWSYLNIPSFEGYGGNGAFQLTGNELTILPNQPVVVFRKAASPATNIVVLGQVQTKPMTHYLSSGANAVGMVFPASGSFTSSGLLSTPGFSKDTTGAQQVGTADVINRLLGTGFDLSMSYVEIPGFPSFDGWYDGSNFQSTQTLDPARAYIVYVNGGTRKWRQAVPFNP